jgi:hypothetical protein
VSATPAPTPPLRPPNGITQQAAVDFSYYFIETVNHAMTTGDVEALNEASWPNCVGCIGVIDHVREIYAAGGSAEGGAWHPRDYAAIKGGPDEWTISIRVKQDAQTVRLTAEAEPNRVEPDHYSLIVDVVERRNELGIERFEAIV